MNDILRVYVLEGLTYLKDVLCRFLLRVVVVRLGFEVFVELSVRAVFQNEVDLVVVIEEAVELHDVLVAQMALYLDLPA